MSEPVLTIEKDDSITELLRLFLAYPIHHLPVVDNRCVVGMLSSADLMKLEFFLPAPGPARDALLNERFRVSAVMRTPVVTIAEHDTVQRAAELMARNGFHSLPVVNSDDHLIGIITTTDLMQGCLQASGLVSRLRPTQPTQSTTVSDRLSAAVTKARESVNSNTDRDGIAAALLRLQPHLRALELVAYEAKRYLTAGQDERLHTALQKAIERVELLDESTAHLPVLGLG